MPLKLKHKLVKSGGSVRIVIPKPVREQLGLKAGDTVYIWLENETIHIEKAKKEEKGS